MDKLNNSIAFIGRKFDELKMAIESKRQEVNFVYPTKKLDTINETLTELLSAFRAFKVDIPETKFEIPEETSLASEQINAIVSAIEDTVQPIDFPENQDVTLTNIAETNALLKEISTKLNKEEEQVTVNLILE